MNIKVIIYVSTKFMFLFIYVSTKFCLLGNAIYKHIGNY